MTFSDVSDLVADAVAMGYMTAVRAYEPVMDELRQSEVNAWLKFNGIELKKFKNLVDRGLIKARRKGESKNSPLYYSKTEIHKALLISAVNDERIRRALGEN